VDDNVSSKMLFTVSAFDEKAGKQQTQNIANYLEERKGLGNGKLLHNLAYTLNERRTVFPWRTAISANSVTDLISLLKGEDLEFSKAPTKPPTIAFVFTGQGAQWNAMGRELSAIYPVYQESIEQSSRYLKAIGASWDLQGKQ
jgi:acyl transferase domain-containing protein